MQNVYAERFGTYRLDNVGSSNSKSLVDMEDIGSEKLRAVAIQNNGYASWVFEEVLAATSTTPARNDAAPPVSHHYTYHSSGYRSGHYARDIAPKGPSTIAKPSGGYKYPLYADKSGYLTYWTSVATINGYSQITRIGNFATIKHSDGTGVLYAHMNAFGNNCSTPQYPSIAGADKPFNPVMQSSQIYVKRGQRIGFLGQTGSVYTSTDTNNHVHIEYFNNYDQAWGNTSKWVYSSTYNSNVRDPKKLYEDVVGINEKQTTESSMFFVLRYLCSIPRRLRLFAFARAFFGSVFRFFYFIFHNPVKRRNPFLFRSGSVNVGVLPVCGGEKGVAGRKNHCQHVQRR